MSQQASSRIWAVIGIGIAVIAVLGLLLAFLGRGLGPLAPMITPAVPTPPDDPVVASVNAHAIHYSFWTELVLLDQVLSGLAGQPAPSPGETLQRLINEELVLEAFSPEQAPTEEQIEAWIAALEQTWGVDDAAVVTALERVGLTRAMFEREIGRLLTVQAGLEALQSQGYDATAWLEEQRASAEIQVFPDVAMPVASGFQSPIAMAGISPIPTPSTETPPPTPAIAVSKVAPDFTLEQSGGGMLTLSEQLAQGPVVLVFFQSGGG